MAIAWGEANENPMQKVRFDRENNQRIRFLSVDEEEWLLPACNNWLRPLVITALNTGFHRPEFLSLTWEDIDFERRAVEIQASYAKNGERRSISMNDLLHRTLEEVRIKSPGPVFPNRKVTQYRNFRTPFNNALWKAEISNFTFHDLRHTFASRPVMSGIDLPTVKELMGHKDITMTLRYTHLSSDHKQNAVKALDNFGTNLRRFSRQYENEVENGSSK